MTVTCYDKRSNTTFLTGHASCAFLVSRLQGFPVEEIEGPERPQ